MFEGGVTRIERDTEGRKRDQDSRRAVWRAIDRCKVVVLPEGEWMNE
jgi:hypothetical protein